MKLTIEQVRVSGPIAAFEIDGKTAVIDADNLYLILGKCICRICGYLATYIRGKNIRIARMVYGDLPEGCELDHINRNRLDNRRNNLRAVSPSENIWNRASWSKVRPFKGVIPNPNGSFQAVIHKENRGYYLGLYLTAEDAAIAYDQKAVELYGDLVNRDNLNLPDRLGEVVKPFCRQNRLTKDQLQKILSTTDIMDKDLATEMGISKGAISRIRTGHTPKYLLRETPIPAI